MIRILLVEDDVDLRLIMEHVLIDGGYEVDTTATVEGGRELLDCRFYDMVVADGKAVGRHGNGKSPIRPGESLQAITRGAESG